MKWVNNKVWIKISFYFEENVSQEIHNNRLMEDNRAMQFFLIQNWTELKLKVHRIYDLWNCNILACIDTNKSMPIRDCSFCCNEFWYLIVYVLQQRMIKNAQKNSLRLVNHSHPFGKMLFTEEDATDILFMHIRTMSYE